ncbi:MAG: cytochrome c oxidase subunit II [Acidobacteria bacterium]|nr:MAG: cytochrome c oxidase subunit II [Acidobacteriota bacterium]
MNWLGRLAAVAAEGAEDIRGGGFWMPQSASTTAPEVDFVFYFILAISAFFFVLIVALTALFVVRYRARPGHSEQDSPTHNTALELTWSIIPSILVLMMFWFGFKAYMDQYNPPANAYEILVEAQKWNWSFQYPNGYIDKDLHVPAGTPVRLVLTSQDVIHSFFVPAFRVKKDVVPGRYNKVWFEATQPGSYVVFCTEYCGTGHSDMLAHVIVHPPGEFEAWLEKAANFLDTLPPAEAGKLLYEQRGCTQCHSVDGSPRVGPTFKGIWGHEVKLRDGSTVPVDEDYLRESIVDPQAKVVDGFDPVMPTYAGRLKDKEITYIIEYLKSLGEEQP